jgi:STE24 endopeptidase
MSLTLPLENFYHAFYLQGISSYGALLVFIMWFGLLDFFLQPLMSSISRKNEFEADAFAKKNLNGEKDLVSALVKLSESNHSMPISHPLFSMMYHSHPPLTERFAALGK